MARHSHILLGDVRSWTYIEPAWNVRLTDKSRILPKRALANFMRTLAMPKTADRLSLTSLSEKLVKIGGDKEHKAGRGPRFAKCGSRTLISVQAAAEWRRSLEKGAA